VEYEGSEDKPVNVVQQAADANHPGRRLGTRMWLLGILLVGLALLTGGNLRLSSLRPSRLNANEDSPAARAVVERGIMDAYPNGSFYGDSPLSREEEIVLLARFHAYVVHRLVFSQEQVDFDSIFRAAQLKLEGKFPAEPETDEPQRDLPSSDALTLPEEYRLAPDDEAYPAACYLTIELQNNWSPQSLLPLRGFTREQAAEAVYELILKLEATSMGQHHWQPTPEEAPPEGPPQEPEAR